MENSDKTSLGQEVAVAILTGGLSRRFGSPKALASLEGRRIIDWMVAAASRLSDEVFLVTGDQPSPPGIACPAYPDRRPGCGPLGGIDSALAHSPRPWVAVMPCDMPLLDGAVYHALAGYRRAGRPVLARSHSGLEPLVSLWPCSLARPVEQALASGDFALYAWTRRWRAVVVDLPAEMPDYRPEWFTNINYREDLQALMDRLSRVSGE